jgi:DNA-binding transcriptional ArsR family regulator
MDAMFEVQADVMRALASPRRLQIIHLLGAGPRDVSGLAQAMGLSQPNVSQHLAVMRASGVVEVERVGREARYRLADPNVIVACGLMREVIRRRLARINLPAADGRAPALVR